MHLYGCIAAVIAAVYHAALLNRSVSSSFVLDFGFLCANAFQQVVVVLDPSRTVANGTLISGLELRSSMLKPYTLSVGRHQMVGVFDKHSRLP